MPAPEDGSCPCAHAAEVVNTAKSNVTAIFAMGRGCLLVIIFIQFKYSFLRKIFRIIQDKAEKRGKVILFSYKKTFLSPEIEREERIWLKIEKWRLQKQSVLQEEAEDIVADGIYHQCK